MALAFLGMALFNAVAATPKTFWQKVFDWGPWTSNVLLVLVGPLQVLLLWQTRQQMARQARDAREQQRAKLGVLLPPDKPTFVPIKVDSEERVSLQGLSLRVANYGYTEAFEVTARGAIAVAESSTGTDLLMERLNIPSVLKRMASAETVETADSRVIAFTEEGYTRTITQAWLDQIKNGTRHLRLIGIVGYVDVYGDKHESPVDFLWIEQQITEKGVRVDRSYWVTQSSKAK